MERAKAGLQPSRRLRLWLGTLWVLLAAGYFFYQLTHPTIEVRWETATELETAGFHLYRSRSPDGEWVQITQAQGLIPSQGNALRGATYTFRDRDVMVGETYYYVLEEVEYDLSTNRHDEQIFAYVPYVTPWTCFLTTISAFIGIVLITRGLKEEKNR